MDGLHLNVNAAGNYSTTVGQSVTVVVIVRLWKSNGMLGPITLVGPLAL